MSGYNQIKGISVKIDGDTTGFQKAINEIKRETSGLDKTMSKLKASMKLNPNDFSSFATYQNLLKDKIQSTSKQLDVYNKKLKEYPKTQQQWTDQVNKSKATLSQYQTKLNSTESAMSALQKEYKTNQTQIQAWKDAIGDSYHTTEQCETAISTLAARNKELTVSMKANSASQKEYNAKIAEQKKNLVDLGSTYEESQRTFNGLRAGAATLNNELKSLNKSFITDNENILKLSHSFGVASQKANQFAETIKPLSALSAAVIVGATKTAIDFEDAWTGVTKTVNATPQQFEKINAGLKDLAQNTSSTYQDIAHYAELAGQMGIPTDSIVGFTKTITELGDTTNLVGEEAAQSIAKFSNVMVSQSKKINTYYSRLGSTIVDLGNKFSTTEADIMDMATRLGVAGKMVGFNSNQVLGLSTALSSLGIEAAAGGGSVSKMLKTIDIAVSTGNDSLSDFAEVSGMTSQQFQKAWGEDAAGTFLKFVEGIGKSSDVTKTLNDLGITEIRQSQSMGALAQSSDVLARALNVSQNAWQANSAMATEAEKRYGTLKSQMSQTWEAVKQAADELGQAFTPTLTSILKVVKKTANAFSNLDDGTQETIAKLLLLTAASYPTAKGLGKIFSGAQKLTNGFGKVSSWVGKTASELNDLSGPVDKTNGLLTKLFKKTGVTTEALKSSSIALGGVGIAVGLAAAEIAVLVPMFEKANKKALENAVKNDAVAQSYLKVVDSVSSFNKKIDEYKEKTETILATNEQNISQSNSLMRTIEQLNGVENKNTIQKQMLQEAVNQLNEIYPDLGLTIDSNTGKVADNTGKVFENNQALEEYIQKVQEAAKQEAYAEAIKEQTKSLIKQQMKYSEVAESVHGLNDKMDELKAKQSQAFKDGDTEKALKYQTQIEQLRKKIDEANGSLATMATKMQETNKTLLDLNNQAETGGYTKIGDSLKQSLQGAIDKAGEAGIQIPEKLTSGIMNGTESYQTASNFVASMMTFQQLVDNASAAGLNIPQDMAYGIISNAGSVSEANTMLNNLIEFEEALTKSGYDGEQISKLCAEGIAKGDITVSEAMKILGNGGVDALEKALNKAEGKADDTQKKVVNALSKGKSGAGTAATGTGDYYTQQLGKALSPGIQNAKNQLQSLQSQYEQLYNAAKKKITFTVETVKVSKDRYVSKQNIDDMSRPVLTDVAPMSADSIAALADTSQYASVDTVDTAFVTGAAIKSTSKATNINISGISKKIDKLIDTVMNTNLTINLQPMQLDGNVVTDTVQEIVSIRDMLKNIGKGVA
nr:MAG TPA: minor tail protein [Caudoviricetes sp.]